MNKSHATLSHDRHALLPGDSGEQTLHNDRCPSPAASSGQGLGEASRAAHAGSQDVAELMQEIEALRRRLLTQPSIEQAKGLLVGFYGIDADTAFTVLVRWSQHTNTKLHLLAAGLVAAASQPCDQPHAGLRRFINQLPNSGPSFLRRSRVNEGNQPGPDTTGSSQPPVIV